MASIKQCAEPQDHHEASIRTHNAYYSHIGLLHIYFYSPFQKSFTQTSPISFEMDTMDRPTFERNFTYSRYPSEDSGLSSGDEDPSTMTGREEGEVSTNDLVPDAERVNGDEGNNGDQVMEDHRMRRILRNFTPSYVFIFLLGVSWILDIS